MLLHFHMTTFFTQVGTPDFKWRGWSKDLLGFEILDSGMMSLSIMNVFDETENVLGCLESWKFGMGYFLRGRGGVLFSPGTFSVLLETLGTLLAFDFYPIRSSPSNPEYPLVLINCLTHPTEGIFCRCVPFAVLFRRKSHTQVIVRSRSLLVAS